MKLVVLAAVVALSVPGSSAAATASPEVHNGWTAAWAAAPQYPNPGWERPNWSTEGFADQSVRQVVRVSTGGSLVRIRLSNRYGTQPVRITAATVAKAGPGPAVRPGTLRPLTFGHRSGATIPVGRDTTSDATILRTSPLESLTVTIYYARSTGPVTFHEGALATTYRAAGDRRFDRDGTAFAADTTRSWYHLTGVDVLGGPQWSPGTVAAFGDSITDGYASTDDANNRYPDQLAERLIASGRHLGVVNAGINGGKLLATSPCVAESGVARFDRDVLDQPGVRTVIVLLGLNDIGTGGLPDMGCGATPVMTPDMIIDGYRALIHAAHARGVRIVGATMTPMKGTDVFDTPTNEAVRDAVNHWIRTGGEYDAVVDFEHALADPADPDALHPAYDSGDHIHPNDAGRAAMAAAVNLADL